MRRAARSNTGSRPARVRCAVYTRKSHEEGLEQDFNSLDAQREACEAYIASQKHEGWICLTEMYDDGGVSGATMERPALARLLEDIKARRIDTVVVYKVDRMTRSLGDFAKIVEVFDGHKVSFVSVTQQFNTTTSMGRLTLNMLLSFAQFEREVTGERIRDKIAASKKKGMWMGGLPPLGYDVSDRTLVANPLEAETVRFIYRRYLELGSVATLKDDLDSQGITSKARTDRYGRRTGNKPIARGALYLMLQNRIYRGEIVHKDHSYPGKHEAIIDEDLWDAVQRELKDNRIERSTGAKASHPSLLAGLIHDDKGMPMTPSHANKKGTRYRYYVSRDLVSGRRSDAPRGRRVPAGDLEGIVDDRLCRFLGSNAEIFDVLASQTTDTTDCMDLVSRAADLAGRWPSLAPSEKRVIVTTLVERIDLLRDSVQIRIKPHQLAAVFQASNIGRHASSPAESLTLTVPARLKRTGIESRMLIDGADTDARRKPDHSLYRLLAQAHRFRQMVLHSSGKSMTDLAAEAGVGGSYFSRVLRVGFLAPDIVTAILRNRHPLNLTAKRLASGSQIAANWDDQRSSLGIA